MARVYIDITELLKWTIRRTGVQRVTHEVIMEYSKQQDIGLIYFSVSLKKFFEVDVEDYVNRTLEAIQKDSQGYFCSRYTVFSLAYSRA